MRRWFIGAIIWTAIGLAFGTQFYFAALGFGRPIPWIRAAANGLREWYFWALLSLLIWKLADQYPLERNVFRRNLGIHLAACLGCVVAYETVGFIFSYLFPNFLGLGPTHAKGGDAGDKGFARLLVGIISFKAAFDAVIYWMLVFARSAFNYYRRLQERDRIEAELKSSLADARLRALKMQLQPHFLFNTLNAIAALVRTDAKTAEDMISSLSDFLRATLELADRQEVTLQEELSFIQRYLGIEQLRFGDRLTVQMDIDPKVLRARVPPLILQPIIENAMKHGVEPNLGNSLVVVTAKHETGGLTIEVQDNGSGFVEPVQRGIGLENTRARLQQLYPNQHRLLCETSEKGGARVTLLLPLKLAPDPESPSAAAAELQKSSC